MKILVDGYNLIFECGLHGKNVNSHSLARARERLLRTLALHFQDELKEIVVVFDAKRQMLAGQKEQEIIGGLTVFYSIHFNDADEMMEHLIQKHSAPKSLLVVSSDHRLHKAAARRKAMAIDSDKWWDQIAESLEAKIEPANKDDDISPIFSSAELEQFKAALENEIEDSRDDWMKDQ